MSRWRRYGGAFVRYRWLLGVLAVALLLDVLFFTGYYAYDDKDYTWAAHQIAAGENFLMPRSENYELAAVRMAFNFPLALVYKLTNGSVAWLCAFQMLYHLGCVVVAYALARTVANERAGRIAAAVAAVCPLYYNFAGVMMPDVALAMWTGLSLLLLVRAIHRAKHPDEPGWRSSRLFLVAGLVLGIAYSVKATAILLCFPSAIAIIAAFPSLRQPRWLVHGAWLALGVAVVLLSELVIFRALMGEWNSQLTIAQDSTNWDFPKWMAKQGTNPVFRILHAVRDLRAHMPVMFIALAVGVLAHTISRRRNVAIVTFAWFNFIYLTVGTVSLTRYLPQPLFARYFTLIVIPATVALACAITYGLEWYATWEKRPRRVTPRVVSIALLVIGVGTAIFEVHANRRFAGAMSNREWALSFVRAYERAKQEYPQYPIVLSMEASYTLLPLLLPDLSSSVYWHAPGVPWGNDNKTTPKPPFIFLDWTRESQRSGLARIPNVDLEHVEIETIAIVRAGEGPWLGRDPDTATTPNSSTIQLVRPAATTREPAPIVQVHTDGARDIDVNSDVTGVSLRWAQPAKFDAVYFDNKDVVYSPSSVTDAVYPPAKEITVTLGARALGGDVTGSVEVIAYADKGTVVDRATRPLTVTGVVQPIVATLRGTDIQAYRVRWSIDARMAGGVQLDPIQINTVPTDATARIAGATKPVQVAALAKGEITIKSNGAHTDVRWGNIAARFAVQYFEDRNYRRAPLAESAKLRAEGSVTAFTVSGAIRQLDGAPVVADIEVFAYGEDRELSGQATKRLTLGPSSTPFTLEVKSTRQASAYRVRWWFDGKGPASVELATITATPTRF